MSEIDDILKKMKEGLGEMAEEAREKYNDLMEYLDNHSSEEIKSDLQKMASKAKEAGISMVVFDRNGYLYHGRVKSLADAAREEGLIF